MLHACGNLQTTYGKCENIAELEYKPVITYQHRYNILRHVLTFMAKKITLFELHFDDVKLGSFGHAAGSEVAEDDATASANVDESDGGGRERVIGILGMLVVVGAVGALIRRIRSSRRAGTQVEISEYESESQVMDS